MHIEGAKTMDTTYGFQLLAENAYDIFSLINSYCSDKRDAMLVYQLVVNTVGSGETEEEVERNKFDPAMFVHPSDSNIAYYETMQLYFAAYDALVERGDRDAD